MLDKVFSLCCVVRVAQSWAVRSVGVLDLGFGSTCSVGLVSGCAPGPPSPIICWKVLPVPVHFALPEEGAEGVSSPGMGESECGVQKERFRSWIPCRVSWHVAAGVRLLSPAGPFVPFSLWWDVLVLTSPCGRRPPVF